jgi:hypothetical protein
MFDNDVYDDKFLGWVVWSGNKMDEQFFGQNLFYRLFK